MVVVVRYSDNNSSIMLICAFSFTCYMNVIKSLAPSSAQSVLQCLSSFSPFFRLLFVQIVKTDLNVSENLHVTYAMNSPHDGLFGFCSVRNVLVPFFCSLHCLPLLCKCSSVIGWLAGCSFFDNV